MRGPLPALLACACGLALLCAGLLLFCALSQGDAGRYASIRNPYWPFTVELQVRDR